MQHAISFCQEHDDPELWDDLIKECEDKPGKFWKYIKMYNTNYNIVF